MLVGNKNSLGFSCHSISKTSRSIQPEVTSTLWRYLFMFGWIFYAFKTMWCNISFELKMFEKNAVESRYKTQSVKRLNIQEEKKINSIGFTTKRSLFTIIFAWLYCCADLLYLVRMEKIEFFIIKMCKCKTIP